MNLINSTNAKKFGIIFLIFSVFVGALFYASQEIDALNLSMYTEMFGLQQEKLDLTIKELQSLRNTFNLGNVKSFSDLSELYYNFIDKYKVFLSTLSSQQKVNVINIIGLLILMSSLTGIVTLLIGDQIINYLKLEIRFPKFAKYIKYKQTINKNSLRFYIVLFYIQLLIFISLSIFMFFIDYFYFNL